MSTPTFNILEFDERLVIAKLEYYLMILQSKFLLDQPIKSLLLELVKIERDLQAITDQAKVQPKINELLGFAMGLAALLGEILNDNETDIDIKIISRSKTV